MVSAYAGWRMGDAFFAPQLSVGSGDFASRRTVPVGSITRISRANWSGYLASGGAMLGYIIDFGGFQLIPKIAIDGLYLTLGNAQHYFTVLGR